MQLSVIVPTRNRAHLWRSRWLTDSLLTQTSHPDELVIASDHCSDDTLDAARIGTADLPFQTRLIDILAPRPEPHPASGVPDNCLIHAARGAILVHVDDDIKLPPTFITTVRTLMEVLPPAIIWPETVFVDDNGTQFEGDYRTTATARLKLPSLPAGLVQLQRQNPLHWGAVWTCCARDIRRLGGHNLDQCQWHNTDTRLGNRMARAVGSFFTRNPSLQSRHLGPTWHMQNQHRPDVIRATEGTRGGQTVANGGQAFWTSAWFNSAYIELDLNTGTAII